MTEELEPGVQAFHSGDFEQAISLLEDACSRTTPNVDAFLYLGAAYGKTGRHSDAVTVLTRAGQLWPADAALRYNLGVALEHSGAIEQAKSAYRQATLLQPGYERANEALLRLAAAEPSSVASSISAPDPTTSFSIPAGVPEPARPLPATPHVRPAALPSHGLLDKYSASPNAPAGPTSVAPTLIGPMPPPNYHDELDFVQAVRDLFQILLSPVRFFQSQAGRSGYMSPVCMIALYVGLSGAIGLFVAASYGLGNFVGALFSLPLSLLMSAAGIMTSYLFTTVFVHLFAMAFKSRVDYAVTFRACTYSDVPRWVIAVILSLGIGLMLGHAVANARNNKTEIKARVERIIDQAVAADEQRHSAKHGGTTDSSASSRAPSTSVIVTVVKNLAWEFFKTFGVIIVPVLILNFVGWIWSVVLLGIAVSKMHGLSPPRAALVVVFTYLSEMALSLLLLVTFGGLIFALFSLVLRQIPAAAGAGGHG